MISAAITFPTAANVLSLTRVRGEARRVAEKLNLSKIDRVRDWARANGQSSPFARLVERAKLHLHAESDSTALALFGFAFADLFAARFAHKQSETTCAARRAAALRLLRSCSTIVELVFEPLADSRRVNRLLVRAMLDFARMGCAAQILNGGKN